MRNPSYAFEGPEHLFVCIWAGHYHRPLQHYLLELDLPVYVMHVGNGKPGGTSGRKEKELSLISYQAALAGSLAVKVDADYTSKACPMCGHTTDENRPSRGLLFVCQNPKCRYTLHADLIGARNVTLRTLLVRHDWIRTGCLSLIPDASDREAKAARLSRYAELRWSPDVTQASGF